MKLEGKKAIVTGANRGIGRAIAVAFAKEGADVLISYRSDKNGAEKTLELIAQSGRKGFAEFADFSKSEQTKIFFGSALKQLGKVDILVNNAGAYDTSAFLELDNQVFESMLMVGVIAPMILTQLAAKNMIDTQTPGSIINISSISGLRPYPKRVAHSAVKAALIMLTKNTALELAPHKIRVNAIAPGDTPYETKNASSLVDPKIPLQRKGTGLDQANAAIFLASEDSSWITGDILTIDGGQALSF